MDQCQTKKAQGPMPKLDESVGTKHTFKPKNNDLFTSKKMCMSVRLSALSITLTFENFERCFLKKF